MPDVLWIESPSIRWDIHQPFSDVAGRASASNGLEVRGRVEYQSERTAPEFQSCIDIRYNDRDMINVFYHEHQKPVGRYSPQISRSV